MSKYLILLQKGKGKIVMMTKSRQNVLNAIIDYITEHQYPPSVRDICDMTGLRSTATVHRHIEKLLKDGFLETDCGIGTPRALRVCGYKFVKERKE